jgi:hypothetical protein
VNKFQVFIIAIFILFLDDNLLMIIGYPHKDVDASTIFKVHPLFYFTILTFAFFIVTGKIKIGDLVRNCRAELYLCTFCVIMLAYLFIMDRLYSVSFILDAFLSPAILAILLRNTPIWVLKKYSWSIYLAFFLNFGLALFEYVTHSPILSTDYLAEFSDFRSTALYGHPLNNALIMSTLGIFLFCTTEKLVLKLIILLVAIASLLCFGARGAIIGIVGGVLISIIQSLARYDIKENLKYIAGITAVFLAGLLLLLNTSLGQRIVNQGSMTTDNSVLERVRTLNLLSIMDTDQFQWGMNDNAIEVLMHKGGVDIIENGFVVWITRFGIFLSILLFLVLLKFISKQIIFFEKSSLLPILFTFLLVAYTNNALSSRTRAIGVLVLCCFMLSKQRVLYFIYQKGEE